MHRPGPPGRPPGVYARRRISSYGLASATAFFLAFLFYLTLLSPFRSRRPDAPPSTPVTIDTGQSPVSSGPAAAPYFNNGAPNTTPTPAHSGPEWSAPPLPAYREPVAWMPPVRLVAPPPPPVVYRQPPSAQSWSPTNSPGYTSVTTPDEVAARVRSSVVLVVARHGRSIRHGAGFPLGPRVLLTCAHVAQGAGGMVLVTADGRQLRVAGGATDAVNDLALLYTDGDLPPALVLAGDAVPVGEQVAVTGFPSVSPFLQTGRGLSAETVPGVVSARVNRVSPGNFAVDSLRIDAEVRPGYSGGPVYSLRSGAVLGMLSFRVVDSRVEGYAAPVTAIRNLLARQSRGP